MKKKKKKNTKNHFHLQPSLGATCLHRAAQSNCLEVVRLLLERNSEDASSRREELVQLRDVDGNLPLHKCTQAGCYDLILEAFPEGAQVMNNKGELPAQRKQ